eukprot:2364059-Rhodomonas_salina.5
MPWREVDCWDVEREGSGAAGKRGPVKQASGGGEVFGSLPAVQVLCVWVLWARWIGTAER